jgi:predicted transcriptional regulator
MKSRQEAALRFLLSRLPFVRIAEAGHRRPVDFGTESARSLRTFVVVVAETAAVRYARSMVTISVEEGLLLDLKKLAEKLGRPLEALTAEALRGYVTTTRQIVDDVAVSRGQFARGEGVGIDEFDAELQKRRAKTE